jgi:hypothetical protein
VTFVQTSLEWIRNPPSSHFIIQNSSKYNIKKQAKFAPHTSLKMHSLNMNYNLKNSTLLLIILALIISCNQNQSQEVITINEETDSLAAIITNLDEQIMITHDEVMPKIGLVLSLRRNINAKIDSCRTNHCKEELQKISYALTKADADMMQWMRNYQTPHGKDTAITYLQNQQIEIDRVKQQILQSIDAAKKVAP